MLNYLRHLCLICIMSTVLTIPVIAQDKITELAPGVYNLYLGGYSSLVIISSDEVLITDPSGTWRANQLKREVAKLTDKPVTHILLSHEHYDHVWGTAVFEGAKVICHANCKFVFDLDVGGGLPEKIDITYHDKHTLMIGDIAVELHYFGPSDGNASTVTYLPNHKVLFTADLYTAGSIGQAIFQDDKNYLGIRKTLREVADWDVEYAINSHYPSMDSNDLHTAREFVDDLYNAVVEANKEADEVNEDYIQRYTTFPQRVKLPKYEDWDNYKDLPKHVFRMFVSIIHGG